MKRLPYTKPERFPNNDKKTNTVWKTVINEAAHAAVRDNGCMTTKC